MIMNEFGALFETHFIDGRSNAFKIINEKRLDLISEALSFPKGEQDNPIKTVIFRLSDEKEVAFLKPGKENARKKPNINDMLPFVGTNDTNIFAGYDFHSIWKYLLEISIINPLTFKKILVLIYRICYYFDHNEVDEKYRYIPNQEQLEYITKLNFTLKEGFNGIFKNDTIDLLDFLYFVDLLGWNEDVKYNVNPNGEPEFVKTKRTRRVNTLLTIIGVPVIVSKFIVNLSENVKTKDKIEIDLILNAMQRFTRTRGICVLTKNEFRDFFNGFIQFNNK